MNKKGFTLVETIIALAIIAILSLVVVPNIIMVIDKNKEKSCNSLIKNIESAAKLYVNNNKYDLNFTCGGTIEIKFQTLVDSGDLKLEDNDKLTNPVNKSEVNLDNTVSVTYNCDTNEFLYSVNGINCTDSADDCEGIATMPTIENKIYTGSEQTGVTGGTNINIIGDKSATNLGTYTVTIVPDGKACWDDDTRARIEGTWKIDENRPSIMLNEKTEEWTGSSILINPAVVTGTDGARLNDIPVIYTYFTGNGCALANQISGEPIEVGSYSVKAYTNSYNNYNANESSCTKLTITKATAILTTSTSSIRPTYPNNGSFTYTYNGDGVLSCSSSNTTIASCSLDTDTNTVTVTPKKKGSVTITVSAGESAHYKPTSKTVSVNIQGQMNPLVVSPINGLVYNKNAQTLVTASNAQGTVYYSTSTSLTDSNYSSKGSTSVPKGTNSGTYTVYYYTPGNNYYASKSGSVSVVISKASCSCTISNVSTLGYPNTTSGTVTYSCTGDGTRDVTSSNTSILTVGTIEETSANLTAKKDGNSTLTVSQGAGSNYNACSTATKSVTVNIDILDNPLTVSARNLTYTGSEQTLVTASNAKGTVYYSTISQLTSSNYISSGSTSIPKGTNAGKYTVYYYTPGNADYAPKSGSVTVTIEKASCSCSFSSVSTLSYPGTTSGSTSYSCNGDGKRSLTSSDTSVVSLGTVGITSTALTALKTGSSTLTLSQAAGTNYNGCTSATNSVTVSSTTYTVNYNANGGSNAPSSQTKTYGVDLTLSSAVPKKDGYIFSGWSTSSTATNATYSAGGTYTTNKSATLYAIWKKSLVEHITNLYTNAQKTEVTINTIPYNYAPSVSLMNDRLGGNTSDYDAGNIRYYSANPSNYIDIGDRDASGKVIPWRIIGVFKNMKLANGSRDTLVKVIRDASLNEDGMMWDISNDNNWHTATLQEYLNTGEYFTGLSQDVKNKIERVEWNLGGVYSMIGYYPNIIYNVERGGAKCPKCTYQTTWTGDIAIMYPSDYGFAVDLSKCTVSGMSYSLDKTNCTGTNWLFNNKYQWLLTPNTASGETSLFVQRAGGIGGNHFLNETQDVRPVLFLNSDLIIESGNGTSVSDPYVVRYETY